MRHHRLVDGEPVVVPREDEFDIIDHRRPRGEGFVQVGEIARPMVERLAQHLAANGLVDPSKAEGREADRG
ncbi:MAG: hypothetical protein FD144_4787 [Rhodospirillaceae bacterium]|nr:MAG: hypothetical protein FD144_4787 [Rhodospirillaceae bacterium]